MICSDYYLTDCPVGGAVLACFVFAWKGEGGIKKYQKPKFGRGLVDPHDETTFSPDEAVLEFELRTVPVEWLEAGEAPAWVRLV